MCMATEIHGLAMTPLRSIAMLIATIDNVLSPVWISIKTNASAAIVHLVLNIERLLTHIHSWRSFHQNSGEIHAPPGSEVARYTRSLLGPFIQTVYNISRILPTSAQP